MIQPCVATACAGCYREVHECGCSSVRIPQATPSQMERALWRRWSEGGPTVPEVRWLYAYRLDLPLERVRVAAHGTTWHVALEADVADIDWGAYHALGLAVRGASQSHLTIHVDVSPRRRSKRPAA